MKILALSHLFPNNLRETQGLFVYERLRHMADHADVRVVAPVPWFPFPTLFRRYAGSGRVAAERVRGGLRILHPRFPILPGLHVLTGLAYAASLLLRPSVRRLLRDAEVVDVHWTFPDAFAGALLSAWAGKPYVVTIRGHEAFYAGQGFLRERLIRRVLRRAAGVIAVSEELRKRTLEAAGGPPGRVVTVPNGVDTGRFRPLDRRECRRKLGLDEGSRIVLSVGRISPGKGFHHLVRALPGVLADHPSALLVIVGEADPEGGEAYLAQLRAEAERLGVAERVLFPGRAMADGLPEWYSACDCFCLASASEGSPNVVLEALACGRPVAATRVGDLGERLSDPRLGILVDGTPPDFYPPLSAALSKTWDEDYIFRTMKARDWGWCAGKAAAAIVGFLR